MKPFEQFLFEVEYKHIESIDFDIKDLPFKNIFGSATRIVKPLETYDYDINEKLKELGYTVDWDKKTASKEILTQQGYKTTTVGLGKIIEKLAKEDKKWLSKKNWWAKAGSDYSIVLSRHPIDILRMSDHSGIQSCHSPDGSYFQCAIDEAESGGPVAFLVKRKDIESIDKEKIAGEDEIFYDKDRHIPGIKPISRIRVRRYQNKYDEENLAIPETRVYGNDIPNFYESVLKWLRDLQNIEERPTLKSLTRMGGSYQDTPDGALLNVFFNDRVDKDNENTTFEGGDDEYDQDNQQRQEMAEIYAEYSEKFEHIELSYYENDDGALSFIFDSVFYIKFDYPLNSIPGKSDLKELVEELNKNNYTNLTRYEDVTKEYFGFKIEIDDFGNADDFRHYCSTLESYYEDKYDDLKKDTYNWLIREGFVDSHFINFTDYLQKQNVPDHDERSDMIPEDEWQELKDLNHFSWSQNFSQIHLGTDPVLVGIVSQSYVNNQILPYHKSTIEYSIKGSITRFANGKATRWKNIPNLPGMTSRMPAITRLAETDFEVNITTDKKNVYIDFNIYIPYNANLREIGAKIRLAKVMDANYGEILEIAKRSFDWLAKRSILSQKDPKNPVPLNLSTLGKI